VGRRSDLPRIRNDAYATPLAAVTPLVPFLNQTTPFVEPCVGDGALVRHLEACGRVCVAAFDVAPRHPSIVVRDALTLTATDLVGTECIISNLPWTRSILHPLINHLRDLRPVWTVIDATWAHTKQAAELILYCSQIVSIGRLRWFVGTSSGGKDDAAWYKFEAEPASTIFTGRAP
jgi:hypothetical protein